MTGTARGLLLVLPLAVCVARSAAAQTACDRACLTGIADQYFAAMVAHVFGLSMFHHPMNEY